ncbi:isochorismatase family protein [candidate division KSB1 bacterium]|nr:isochorismatase family protein [candidate division KSB1 bacterium]
MLDKNNVVLIIVDVQGKLSQIMYKKEDLFENLRKIIQGAKVLEIPVIWNEQLPEKLGETAPELKALLTDNEPIRKECFSCWNEPNFVDRLNNVNRKQVLLVGIETHVCVYQTAADLLEQGYEVHVVSDAVSSRKKSDKKVGLEKMKDLGAQMTSVETALFEMLHVARGPQFKEIIRIVK